MSKLGFEFFLKDLSPSKTLINKIHAINKEL